ncbi:MAG: nitroreductase family protein [Lentimicrobiaceae bacterium]|jgi:ferredoxin|nr:nitroreductase family protein [Lentimicrobiaceae bacterium]MDD4599371.1 nitroreductase family protein [Lentimicrobiaceae bacterium]MDY0027272.1 nitroreductase family protein [Lentimicrobium sp.]HAH57147.1 nitroreductase [Bacteroidales bacterium]
MAIPTSRAKEAAEISVNADECNACGLCVNICGDLSLKMENGVARKSETAIFGCIGCGHCMAVCPTGAIEIHGREISPADIFDLPAKESAATYEQVISLFERRRSIRTFKDQDVEAEVIEKILKAAKTAPMGLPPSDVHVMVLKGKEQTRAFAKDFCDYLETMKWFVSGWFLTLMRPFWGKANDEMFKGFVRPLFKIYPGKMRENINVVNYDAPLLMYFYGSPYTDPADPIIAATYAMTAAESLGLGTCMLGAVHPLIQHGSKARKFREDHGIKFPGREGLFVAIGYPAVKFKKGIRRTFASDQ